MATRPAQNAELADREIGTELKAAVHARRELGSDMEDYVLEGFLARIEERVDQRVMQRQSVEEIGKRKKKARLESPIKIMGATFILAIPLLGIAGNVAGTFGVVTVMAALVFINTLYFVDRWVQLD